MGGLVVKLNVLFIVKLIEVYVESAVGECLELELNLKIHCLPWRTFDPVFLCYSRDVKMWMM